MTECYIGANSKQIAIWLNAQMGCHCITPSNPYGTDKCTCAGVYNQTLCCSQKMTLLFTIEPQDMSECMPGIHIMVDNMRTTCSSATMDYKCVVAPSAKICNDENQPYAIVYQVVFAVCAVFAVMTKGLSISNFRYTLLNTVNSESKPKSISTITRDLI
jgi:hypothetical protein